MFKQSNGIYAFDNPKLFSLIDLDWSLIGINEEVASVTLGWNANDQKQLLSVSFGEGRNGLFLELDSVEIVSPLAKQQRLWSKIGDGIYVYCD